MTLASLALGTVLVTSTQTAWSQANTATFYGSVTDPSGAVIPGANVKLTKQDTQETLTKTARVAVTSPSPSFLSVSTR